MIDLRCHILSTVACGPSSFDQSLDMCRSAADEGVKTIVATPLWEAGSEAPPALIAKCRSALEQLQCGMGDTVSFKLGLVMQFSPLLPSLIDEYATDLTLGGGRHVLVSLPPLGPPEAFEEVWKQVSRRGFSILLARPECAPGLRQQPSRLDEWVAGGIEMQVDAASVTGDYGRDIQRFALRCLGKYGGRAVLASNTRAGGAKSPSLRLAREVVEKKFGPRHAWKLVEGRPAEILSGHTQDAEPLRKTTRAGSPFSLLSLIRRKKAALENT